MSGLVSLSLKPNGGAALLMDAILSYLRRHRRAARHGSKQVEIAKANRKFNALAINQDLD